MGYGARRMPPINASRFSMVARGDVPRSKFRNTKRHKTTFNTGYLIPIYVGECLPGDSWNIKLDVFARMLNFINPVIDDIYFETFGFFTPNRLVWDNFVRQMGEQDDPIDSISYLTPYVESPVGGFAVCSLYDYMGLPTVGQVDGGSTIRVSALPLRMHNLIYNQWFRNENIQDSLAQPTGDGPDSNTNYALQYRNKQADRYTTALPWPQKGGDAVTMPLSGTAPVKGLAIYTGSVYGGGLPADWKETGTSADVNYAAHQFPMDLADADAPLMAVLTGAGNRPQVYADLSQATGATINALRQSFAMQQFLEKNARGGTRYTELLVSHFGVQNEDYRLQRPEYIGGGKGILQVSAVAQTTPVNGGSTPLGQLAATGTLSDRHHFSYHVKEHGSIIIYVQVSAPKAYQQGLDKQWTRRTREDYFWTTFEHLGEAAVLRKELYATGLVTDDTVFGYQERYYEYKDELSLTTGLMKSTSTLNIDEWHLAQQFGSAPELNTGFLRDQLPFSRILQAGDAADKLQIIWDSMFTIEKTRPMSMRSTPGLMKL